MKRFFLGLSLMVSAFGAYVMQHAEFKLPLPSLDFSFARPNPIHATEQMRARQEPGKAMLIIQGGCLNVPSSQLTPEAVALLRETLSDALQTGEGDIRSGRDAMYVVRSVLAKLEDSGVFDAGKGASEVGHKLEAFVQNGGNGKPGYVLGTTNCPNPSLLAWQASGRTFMVGSDADNFGKSLELPTVKAAYFQRRNIRWTTGSGRDSPVYGPVGVVCMTKGQLAAGCSGSLAPGQAPLSLYGTLADRDVAVVCTGTPYGSTFMEERPASKLQYLTSREQQPLRKAVETVLLSLTRGGSSNAGIIALDAQQNLSVCYTSKGFAHAWLDSEFGNHISLYPEEE